MQGIECSIRLARGQKCYRHFNRQTPNTDIRSNHFVVVSFRFIIMLSGSDGTQTLQGVNKSHSLLYVEKQYVAVQITNAFMEGDSAIPYTNCEIYAPRDFQTHVWTERLLEWGFIADQIHEEVFMNATETRVFDETVVNLVAPLPSNYYHWIAEGLVKFGIVT